MQVRILKSILSLTNIRTIFCSVWLLIILAAFFTGQRPSLPKPNVPLLLTLLEGNNRGYFPYGADLFQEWAPYLPARSNVSFLMNHDYTPYVKTIGQLYTAQSYFAPRLINPNPEELAAIVYCSTDRIAEFQMLKHGYHSLKKFGEGKFIAAKNP